MLAAIAISTVATITATAAVSPVAAIPSAVADAAAIPTVTAVADTAIASVAIAGSHADGDCAALQREEDIPLRGETTGHPGLNRDVSRAEARRNDQVDLIETRAR